MLCYRTYGITATEYGHINEWISGKAQELGMECPSYDRLGHFIGPVTLWIGDRELEDVLETFLEGMEGG